mmetsp:Transcript_10842/g.20684  ORF Transcript_10842/g.20684 Transcript_10842/m.20684 type:complete len:113 (-) Transcript_10842:93-431(-)
MAVVVFTIVVLFCGLSSLLSVSSPTRGSVFSGSSFEGGDDDDDDDDDDSTIIIGVVMMDYLVYSFFCVGRQTKESSSSSSSSRWMKSLDGYNTTECNPQSYQSMNVTKEILF